MAAGGTFVGIWGQKWQHTEMTSFSEFTHFTPCSRLSNEQLKKIHMTCAMVDFRCHLA